MCRSLPSRQRPGRRFDRAFERDAASRARQPPSSGVNARFPRRNSSREPRRTRVEPGMAAASANRRAGRRSTRAAAPIIEATPHGRHHQNDVGRACRSRIVAPVAGQPLSGVTPRGIAAPSAAPSRNHHARALTARQMRRGHPICMSKLHGSVHVVDRRARHAGSVAAPRTPAIVASASKVRDAGSNRVDQRGFEVIPGRLTTRSWGRVAGGRPA
jgi:hypothetical protein